MAMVIAVITFLKRLLVIHVYCMGISLDNDEIYPVNNGEVA